MVEVGGWDGALASDMLARFPEIESWRNYEVAAPPLENPACKDERYEALIPDDFLWRAGEDLSGFNVFVSSHAIEHMRAADLAGLVDMLTGTRLVCLQAPLRESDEDRAWDGYEGTHILEIGWKQVAEMFAHKGFSVFCVRPEMRWLKR